MQLILGLMIGLFIGFVLGIIIASGRDDKDR